MKTAWDSIRRNGIHIREGRVCIVAGSAIEARDAANDVRSAGLLARWLGFGDGYEVHVYEDARTVQSAIGAGAPPDVVSTLRNAVQAVRSITPHTQGA